MKFESFQWKTGNNKKGVFEINFKVITERINKMKTNNDEYDDDDDEDEDENDKDGLMRMTKMMMMTMIFELKYVRNLWSLSVE